MALLVASIVKNLTSRCGGMTATASLDSNSYNEAVSTSARELGITLADPLNAVDSDLTAVTQDQATQFLDVAELRLLESALANYTKVDQKISLGSISFGQLRSDLEALVARKAAYVRMRYGIGLGTLGGAIVDLQFQEAGNDLTDPGYPAGVYS